MLRRRLERKEVLLNVKGGEKAFRGVLWKLGHSYVVMRQATLLEDGKELPVDGDILIERANVEFYQVISPNGKAG